MSELNNLIKKYSINRSKKMKSLSEPLETHLGINTFSYYSIESDGRFVFMSNYAEQAEFYYSNKLFLKNPYLVHPDLLENGCVMTTTTPYEEYKSSIDIAYNKYHIHNPLLMIQKSENRIEGFFFGSDSRKKQNVDYVENLDLLKKFAGYFKHESQELIKQIQSEKYNIFKEKGGDFLSRDPSLPLSSQNKRSNDFLRSICPLSKRELQCLDLYKKGHSSQSTAAILGLSQRTVEHYFENIKIKLGCYSKSELLCR